MSNFVFLMSVTIIDHNDADTKINRFTMCISSYNALIDYTEYNIASNNFMIIMNIPFLV